MKSGKYNMNTTLKEIFQDENIRRHLSVFFADFLIRRIPETMIDYTLAGIASELIMPWGAPYPAGQLLQAANAVADAIEGKYTFIPLWRNEKERPRTMKADPFFIPENVGKGKEDVCLIAMNRPAESLRPAAIICPGGGYTALSITDDGIVFSEKLEENGIRAFILLYRLMPNRYPAPQLDLARAVIYIREHADELGVIPDDLMIIGDSAGGHLAATYAGNAQDYTERAAAEYGVP